MEIEKESLAAHVDICALRYQNLSLQYDGLSKNFEKLENRLDNLEDKFDTLLDVVRTSQATTSKVLIGTGGTIIAGILTTVVVLLMK